MPQRPVRQIRRSADLSREALRAESDRPPPRGRPPVEVGEVLRWAKPVLQPIWTTGWNTVAMTTCLRDGSVGDGTEAINVEVWNQGGQRRVRGETTDVFGIREEGGEWFAWLVPWVDIYYAG